MNIYLKYKLKLFLGEIHEENKKKKKKKDTKLLEKKRKEKENLDNEFIC